MAGLHSSLFDKILGDGGKDTRREGAGATCFMPLLDRISCLIRALLFRHNCVGKCAVTSKAKVGVTFAVAYPPLPFANS